MSISPEFRSEAEFRQNIPVESKNRIDNCSILSFQFWLETFKEKTKTIKTLYAAIFREKVFLLPWETFFEIFRHLRIIFLRNQLYILIYHETLYLSTYLNIILRLIYRRNITKWITVTPSPLNRRPPYIRRPCFRRISNELLQGHALFVSNLGRFHWFSVKMSRTFPSVCGWHVCQDWKRATFVHTAQSKEI